ncbi:hypothetical protein J4P90_20500 [Bacillus sp. SY8(2021)]|uniref:Uncharacterized protein n=1 Tax=Bacillus arachidis TaxID=2819290 RepID=A0ABS3P467_9BACI|nr:hypothetical protein [Bacillus arachidis]
MTNYIQLKFFDGQKMRDMNIGIQKHGISLIDSKEHAIELAYEHIRQYTSEKVMMKGDINT